MSTKYSSRLQEIKGKIFKKGRKKDKKEEEGEKEEEMEEGREEGGRERGRGRNPGSIQMTEIPIHSSLCPSLKIILKKSFIILINSAVIV